MVSHLFALAEDGAPSRSACESSAGLLQALHARCESSIPAFLVPKDPHPYGQPELAVVFLAHNIVYPECIQALLPQRWFTTPSD